MWSILGQGEKMRREEKSDIYRHRIITAAIKEFSDKGYRGASLNTVCSENEISKGNIYHYFKDKDELYIHCISECFSELTVYMKEAPIMVSMSAERRLQAYFDMRLRFFTEKPMYLGIFLDVIVNPPKHLKRQLTEVRMEFDQMNITILTSLLEGIPLRNGNSISNIIEDLRMYMDFFNLRFQSVLADTVAPEQAFREHEEMSHRQLDNLLYGVLEHSKEVQRIKL